MAASILSVPYYLDGRKTPAARAAFLLELLIAAETWAINHGERAEVGGIHAIVRAAQDHRARVNGDPRPPAAIEEDE